MRALGLILRSARLRKGVTVGQVSEATNVPVSVIADLEDGRIAEPVLLTVCNLAEHYGIGKDADERERFVAAMTGGKAARP